MLVQDIVVFLWKNAWITCNYPAIFTVERNTRCAPDYNLRFSIKFYDPNKFRYYVDFAVKSINPGIAWLIRQTSTCAA